MSSLSRPAQFVIGVDTHRDTHTGAVLTAQGVAVAKLQVPTTAAGYQQLLSFARAQAPGTRCWAIEGTGSYGRALTRLLMQHQEWVSEADRPRRPARRNGAKSDEIDAVRAAREALARTELAAPRSHGTREALRVLLLGRDGAVRARTRALSQLKALLVTAPEPVRARLRHHSTAAQVQRCARLRTSPLQSPEHRFTLCALRAVARRARLLEREALEHERHLRELMRDLAPQLLAQPGIAAISGARILCAWSHPKRLKSEAAFATLAGVAPLQASSGRTTRHRLNRRGDRQLNCALEMIVRCRLSCHTETRLYAQRRTVQGMSAREIRRCLKRYLARRLYRLLERTKPLDTA